MPSTPSPSYQCYKDFRVLRNSISNPPSKLDPFSLHATSLKHCINDSQALCDKHHSLSFALEPCFPSNYQPHQMPTRENAGSIYRPILWSMKEAVATALETASIAKANMTFSYLRNCSQQLASQHLILDLDLSNRAAHF